METQSELSAMLVKSAERVIKILEMVGSRRNGITHGELAAGLGIPKGSLSKLLSNLVARDYLSLDATGTLYKLGPQLLALTGQYLSNLDIVELGRPIIYGLMSRTNESTELDILKGKEVMVICIANCARPLVRSIAIGATSPAYATAAGKAILAYLPDEEKDGYLSSTKLTPLTKKTITDPNLFRAELESIRGGALAYNREELYEEIIGIAAPIFDMHGRVCASIVIVVPVSRFTPTKRRALEQPLRRASAELSYQLGFRDHPSAGENRGIPHFSREAK